MFRDKCATGLRLKHPAVEPVVAPSVETSATSLLSSNRSTMILSVIEILKARISRTLKLHAKIRSLISLSARRTRDR